ncbi:type III secretion system inner membrane ring subunit SctD [Chlamydia pecorum]|uniref:type III secretion system inner membrane ring subunit SctD n=1 Tax=Chlamydia pecorum TaxID=85991 RepID=UPI00388D58D6
MAARLVINEGPLSGVVFVLDQGESWLIGKDEASNDIPIEDPALAPSQAKIQKTADGYTITNVDASVPILVNGKQISGTVALKSSDIISLGSNQYTFFPEIFDADDVVYDFSLPAEDFSNASGNSADSNRQQAQRAAEPSSQQASVASEKSSAPTAKDQELAEAFLSSAKAEGSGAHSKSPEDLKASETFVKEAKAPQKEKEQPQESKSIMEENEASPEEQVPPQASPPPSSQAESPKPEASASQAAPVPDAPQNPAEAEQARPEEAPSEEPQPAAASSSQPAAESSQEEKGDENADPDIVEDADPEENKELEEGAPKEESQGEEEHEDNKDHVLAPFNIQDLFRFDQGIFLAEVEEGTHKSVSVDLSPPPRFLLKVLAGANIGAEFSLEEGRSYIIGSDPTSADIVFNDISVSHQHAKISVGSDDVIMIEDLGSKNGVIVESKKIEHSSTLTANQVVALGTTLFLLVDHQAPSNTIVATFAPEDYGLFGRPQDAEAIAKQALEEEEEKQKRATLPTGSFILTLFIGGLAILFGVGTASLFHTKEIVPLEHVNYNEDLERIVKQFPTVRYTFNETNGQLFLIGHVKNSIDKSELLYKVDTLAFVKSIDDNVIDDEAVWQEMNIFLSKRPEFKGVSMSSPEPGKFVITGYVKTTDQASCLVDYLNIHFNYLSLLENKVVVESQMLKVISGQLLQNGFANIHVSFVNGEVILTGYVNNDSAEKFRTVVQELSNIPGVRLVKNFAVMLPAEEGIVNLNLRYPNRYRVTGYSKYGDISINVVVNGRILTRGDLIDGMTVTSIQPNAIFLEKEGLKYKIDYNK